MLDERLPNGQNAFDVIRIDLGREKIRDGDSLFSVLIQVFALSLYDGERLTLSVSIDPHSTWHCVSRLVHVSSCKT